MKQHFYMVVLLLSALLISGCNAYRSKQQAAALALPELGSIVHTQGDFWYATTEQIGQPIWEGPLAVSVQQLPFNKASYTTYAKYMAKAGKINGITYVDSLPYKPKYLRLRLLDKIGATTQLNDKTNKEVRGYLENNDAYKMVTALDVTVPDAMMPQILGAHTITMTEDTQLGKQLIVTHGNEETKISFGELQAFNYALSGFCWGENRYHHKVIETILSEDEKCPKGTFKKAAKVTSDRSYLKF